MVPVSSRRKIIIKLVAKNTLKWVTLALAGLIVLFSAIPYLIPFQEGKVDRYTLAYFNSEFMQANDVELHYRKWDYGEGVGEKNILLVHGLGGSTYSWRHNAPALADAGYRVIAVDLPGFGLSERKTGFEHTAAARAEYLWMMLEELYPGADWHLIGHSMGGATVSAMALQQPEKSESVTLAAGALVGSEPSLSRLFLRYPPVSRWAGVLAGTFILNESRIESLLASAYGREASTEEIRGYLHPLLVESTVQTIPEILKANATPLLQNLDKITVPVLCIWGENDQWVPLEQGKELHELFPNSELTVMPEEGHNPMETAPEKFNQLLLDFLKRT